MSLGLGLSKRLASKMQVFRNGLPPDGSTDKIGLAPRWPLVPVLPTPVVDGARYCVGASYDVAVEYFGVGGVWVAQPSKQYGVWVNQDVDQKEVIEVYRPALSSGGSGIWCCELRVPTKELSGRIRFRFDNLLGTALNFDSFIANTIAPNNAVSSVGNSITGNLLTGWKKLTTEGSAQIVIPPSSYAYTEWLDITLLSPTDGKSPIILVESILNGNSFTFDSLFYQNKDIGWNAYSGIGDIGQSASSVGTAMTCMGFQFEPDESQLLAIAVGDSITEGQPTSTPWFGSAGILNVVEANLGVGGYTSNQYLQVLRDSFSVLSPSIVLYPSYTPNDPYFGVSEDQTLANFDSALTLCKQNGAILIPTILAPWNVLDEAGDLRRLRTLYYAIQKTSTQISLIETIDTGAFPDRFASGMTDDQVHPSIVGYTAMRNAYNALATTLYAKTGFWFIA